MITTRFLRQFLAVSAAAIVLGGMATGAELPAGGPGAPAGDAPAMARQDRPPRKVLVGTVVGGNGVTALPLEKRLQRMDEIVDEIARRADRDFAGKPLDLVVLPEFFIARPGDSLTATTVRLEEVQARIAACARRHRCYLVVPMLLHEAGMPLRYSNAAVLVGRDGQVVGIYRKVHPVAAQGSDILEGGTMPGHEFPVFACDFGRLGIQICFDLLYPDGWDALARQGAEIVALPSASPETVRPSLYAYQHQYYIVSATPRDHAAVYSPLGLIDAEATREGAVLVEQIDLSFALVHWEAVLQEGEALRQRFGDRVGYHYYRGEDGGIFWSNDPKTPIGQMIASLGLTESDANVERIRRLQDAARGGPPARP